MAKSGKRSWEKLYEQYQNGEMDQKIEGLKGKLESKKISRDEYKEYEKMTKIKELKEKLKDKELLPEERKKVEADLKKTEKEKADLKIEANKNNIEFGKNNQQLSESDKNNKKFKRRTTEDLKNLITNKKIKISKCNVACSNLMRGASWKSIELKLDQVDERYTGKKEDLERLKKAENPIKTTEEKTETAEKTPEKMENSEKIAPSVEENKADEGIKDDKKGRFGKIMSALRHPIKTFREWRENKTKALPEPGKEKADAQGDKESGNEKADAQGNKEPEKTIDNDFKAYLKEVAEKGMKTADKDRLNAKKEKYKEMERESSDKNAEKDNDDAER